MAEDNVRILVAEDNEVNQMVARELLMQAGVDVAVASNGQQALEALGRQRYDAVLMDVQMPIMDGYEATRRIRQTPALRDNVIMATTAKAGREDKPAAFAAGLLTVHTYRPQASRAAVRTASALILG